MAVAELPVVKHLEAASHGVITYGIGIDDGVRSLDPLPQEGVKPVFIDACPVGRAMKTAEASAGEVKLRQIHDFRLIGNGSAKSFCHALQRTACRKVGNNGDFTRPALPVCRGGILRMLRGADMRCRFRNAAVLCDARLAVPVFHPPQSKAEESLRFLLPLLMQQILHIRGETAEIPQFHVVAVVLNKAMRGNVVEVLGRRNLRGIFSGQIDILFLDQLDEPVQLGRHQKRVYGIAEENQIRRQERCAAGAEVLFIALDSLPDLQGLEVQVRKERLKVFGGIQGNAVFSGGRSVQYEYAFG